MVSYCVEKFLISKSEFILGALDKFENVEKVPLTQYFEENEIRSVITELCKKAYPYYEKKGIGNIHKYARPEDAKEHTMFVITPLPI